MKRRTNGEGTIYETVKKNKRKVFLSEECNICKKCTDRKDCNNRTGWDKCNKCKECVTECLKYCDRFYCYKTIESQVTVNGKRKASGSGKTKKEVAIVKDEKKKLLNLQENMEFGKFTLVETMKYNEKQKLEYKLIGENSYNRNLNTISSIEKHYLSTKKMCELTSNNIKSILAYFVDTQASQSQLEKVYDEIKGACRISNLETLFKNIKRNTFVSNKEKKQVIAFSQQEKAQLLNYIEKHKNTLVSNNSNIDNVTIKNIIKIAFATAMRIGEICCLNFNADIDMSDNKIIVSKTLTKDLNNKTVVGKYTKTGRKNKMSGKSNIRNIPFDMLIDENELINIIDEQIQIAKSNPYNSNLLLFCTEDGNYIEHSSINGIFKRICREAGIKLELPDGCNMHMSKHTAVTELIENGVNIYVISTLVGTSVNVLQKTYAHVLDSFIEREIEKSKINRKNNSAFEYEIEGNCKIIPFRKK